MKAGGICYKMVVIPLDAKNAIIPLYRAQKNIQDLDLLKKHMTIYMTVSFAQSTRWELPLLPERLDEPAAEYQNL